MPSAGLDPAQQLAVTTAQLQVTARILVRQAAAQLLSDVMSLSVELSDQGNDLILHVQRSLWAAEWRTDRLRSPKYAPPTGHLPSRCDSSSHGLLAHRQVHRHTQHRHGLPRPACPADHRHAHRQLDRVPRVPALQAPPLTGHPAGLLAVGGDRPDLAAGAPRTLHRYNSKVPRHYGTMRFGEWMAVKLTTEQQFTIEKQARALVESKDAGVLAAALLKQACYQQQLLQQAVNEIARLECELMNS